MKLNQSTPALLVKTTYQVNPEDAEAFKNITQRMAEDARQREGNAFLLAAQDVSNPAIFHLTEGWENQQAIDKHVANEDFQRVLAEAMQLRIESRSVTVFEVSRSYDVNLPA